MKDTTLLRIIGYTMLGVGGGMIGHLAHSWWAILAILLLVWGADIVFVANARARALSEQ